ncbi:MAG: trehalose-phosphatase [Ramlibacter sp.]|nr:trehalose-phosphatase [Ramlibacter sp.]
MNFVDLLRPSCALFLDFDGSLVDLADQPESVVVPDSLGATLQSLSAYLGGALAVVSGRPIEQIDRFLAPLRLPVAGVHGAERRRADGSLALLPTFALDAVEQAAQALADRHTCLRVEFKRGSVALHYRQAPELADTCLAVMQAAIDQSPGLTLLHGKMVLEAKPGGVGKGHAIDAFMDEPPFAGRQPLFVGDDVTDEAGFGAVQRHGGLGVKVGPGPTLARHRLEDPQSLRHELAHAVANKQKVSA